MSSDDEFDDLLNDPEIQALQAGRIRELQAEMAKRSKQAETETVGVQEYVVLDDEKTLMHVVKDAKKALVHFAHKDFSRCEIVDKHMRILAHGHRECKFVKIDVEKAPFLVDKLGVRMLPCLVAFGKGGVEIFRTAGFDLFGGRDDFETQTMEAAFAIAGVLKVKGLTGTKKRANHRHIDDSDSDQSESE